MLLYRTLTKNPSSDNSNGLAACHKNYTKEHDLKWKYIICEDFIELYKYLYLAYAFRMICLLINFNQLFFVLDKGEKMSKVSPEEERSKISKQVIKW